VDGDGNQSKDLMHVFDISISCSFSPVVSYVETAHLQGHAPFDAKDVDT
jgi:hypothetical protein